MRCSFTRKQKLATRLDVRKKPHHHYLREWLLLRPYDPRPSTGPPHGYLLTIMRRLGRFTVIRSAVIATRNHHSRTETIWQGLPTQFCGSQRNRWTDTSVDIGLVSSALRRPSGCCRVCHNKLDTILWPACTVAPCRMPSPVRACPTSVFLTKPLLVSFWQSCGQPHEGCLTQRSRSVTLAFGRHGDD